MEIVNKIFEQIHDVYELWDGGQIRLDMTSEDLVKEAIVKAINYGRCSKSDREQLPDVYLKELSKVEWTPQTQASLNEQLQILRQFANKLGLYDASDYLKK